MSKRLLREDCFLISGAKRAAIYDLKRGKIYSINQKAKEIIEGGPDNFRFWEKLKKMGLVASKNTSIKKIKPISPSIKLNFLWLEITQKCNLKCIHCYAEAGHDKKINNELSFKDWIIVLRQAFKLGCRKVQFIGGEPFLYPQIFDLANEAKKLGYKFIEIFTNATLLNEQKIKIIKKLGIHLAISLYSNDPQIHDSITGIKGSFEKTFQALRITKKEKIPTRIALIIMKKNEKTVEKTLEFLEKIGHKTKTDIIRPSGREKCSNLIPCQKIIDKYGLIYKPGFSITKYQFWYNHFYNSCWAGKVVISNNGEAFPCIFARNHIVGNIKNKSLREIIFSQKLQRLWKITKDQVKICKDCEYRYACYDCRPLAEATYGNLLAPNPRCTYNPYKGVWSKSNT